MVDRIGQRYGVRPSFLVDPDGEMTPSEALTFDHLCVEVAMAEANRIAGREGSFVAAAVVL